ncbi:MAG: AMP-binding protein [Desulfobacterales bacterium]|nr:AMP-binding protein [Desulfobacterales bacterium]
MADLNHGLFFDMPRETMGWEKRQQDQSERFLNAFRHAYEHSKAYREIYESAGIGPSDVRGIEDLEKLPILRMTDLVERQKRDFPFGGFSAVEPGEIRRIYINSGLIFQPGGDWEYLDTSWTEALCGAGIKAGDRIINTFNYHLWPFAFMLDECAKRIGATVIPTGVGNTMMQVKIMQALRVNGFMGTPSFLMTLAQRAEGMGFDLKKEHALETAFVTAEMLPESLRTRLQDKLEMSIRQAYGTVFLGCIGYECREMTGLHVPVNTLVEVVDPATGKQVPPGTAGEIVGTNFNPFFPILRMATGDLSLWTQERCPCGRTGPMLQKIIGRIDQATKVRGTFVHPWQTDEIISRNPEVFKYQVVISRENHNDVMTFVVELKEDVSQSNLIRSRIERDVKDVLTVRGYVKIVPRGTIPDRHKKIEDRRSWD